MSTWLLCTELKQNTVLVTVSPVDSEANHHRQARSQYLFSPVPMPSDWRLPSNTHAKWGVPLLLLLLPTSLLLLLNL